MKHFSEHGPYFGVYAVVNDTSRGGTISVRDHFRLVKKYPVSVFLKRLDQNEGSDFLCFACI
jgi:uncharacterized membrane protein (DUF4010 family)